MLTINPSFTSTYLLFNFTHMKKETLLELIGLALKENTEETQSPDDIGKGEIRICILQRGWIYVGKYYRKGNNCSLENASCIRAWGTTKGLGEIAEEGPTSNTKLDSTPTVNFHVLGEICTILCNPKKWKL